MLSVAEVELEVAIEKAWTVPQPVDAEVVKVTATLLVLEPPSVELVHDAEELVTDT
jgi:hypothetical protein